MTMPHCRCGESDPQQYYPGRMYACKACIKADAAARYVPHPRAPKSWTNYRAGAPLALGLLALQWLGAF